MNSKIGPYVLVALLAVILVFIIGVRYGQKVEKTNKIINYLISLPPTQTPPPTQKPLEFKTYTHKYCGIRFLYPNSWEISTESSKSARLNLGGITPDQTYSNNFALSFGCDPQATPEKVFEDYKKTATDEIKFQNNKIIFRKDLTPQIPKNQAKTITFQIVNPKNGKKILVTINESYYPLFEKSLEFLP